MMEEHEQTSCMELNIWWTRQRHVCFNKDTASFLGAEVKIDKIKDRLGVLRLGSEISDTRKERNSHERTGLTANIT